jgi:hypothetical protein
VQVQGSSTQGSMLLPAVVRAVVPQITSLPVAAGVLIDQTAACLGNQGSLHITGSSSSSTALVAGDTLTIDANACVSTVDGVQATLNGQLKFEILSGSFPDRAVPPFHIVMKVTATGLSIRTATTLATSNGDETIDWNSTSTTAETLVVSGASLASGQTTSSGFHTTTLANYRQAVAVNGTGMTASLGATITSDNPKLGPNGGLYTISTPQDLRWTTSSTAPTSGSVKVVGAGNSALLVTFSATGATVQVDANGDGTYESSTTATAAQLKALL